MRRRSLLAGLTGWAGTLPIVGSAAWEKTAENVPASAGSEGTESGQGLGGVDARLRPSDTRAVVHWDVIVVGAGGAGLAAAVGAKEAGAKRVLLLEKLSTAGGHTMVASGSLNALVEGFGDSAERFFDDTFEAGEGAADPELVRRLVEGSRQVLPWFRGLGIAFEDVPYEAYNGGWPRAWRSVESHPGFRFISALMRRFMSLGGEVRYGARAAGLLAAPSDRITGVKLLGGEELHARAVVLATGGWGANAHLRRRWRPQLTDIYRTTYSPLRPEEDPATGDGIRMAEAVGARLRDMDAVMAIPYWGGRVLDYTGAEIFLDDTGRRFVDETATWSAIFEKLSQTETSSFWVVTDERSRKSETFAGKFASGVVRSAPDLASLAREMKVDRAVLEETFRQYNAAALSGEDRAFGRTRFMQTIEEPPFYFGRERFDIHYCCGGIAITADAQALSEAGRPIPGLFAAGETTGGVHGRFRLGGNGLTDAFVFGRIAGESAAAWAKR